MGTMHCDIKMAVNPAISLHNSVLYTATSRTLPRLITDLKRWERDSVAIGDNVYGLVRHTDELRESYEKDFGRPEFKLKFS